MHTLYECEGFRGPSVGAPWGASLGAPWGAPEGLRKGQSAAGGGPLDAAARDGSSSSSSGQQAAAAGALSKLDIEVYAYQLEAATAAATAFGMKQQTHLLSDLLQHNISVLRQHALARHNSSTSSSTPSSSSSSGRSGSSSEGSSLFAVSFLSPGAPLLLTPAPPAAAEAAAAAAEEAAAADSSWLFKSAAAAGATHAAAGLFGGGPRPGKEALHAQVSAAVGGPPGGLQWLHDLTRIAADEQAAHSILELAAADPSFPCKGVKRQILLTLCSLSVEGIRVHDALNAVFGPPEQQAATEEQRIGRIIRKSTEAGALEEKKAAAAAAAAAAQEATDHSTSPNEHQNGLQLQQQLQQQLLQQQSAFCGEEALAFLWHLIGLHYQREAATVSPQQASYRRCSSLCFLCALQLSPFSLCCFEAALPVVCSDTSFFLLIPPRRNPTQILEAALNPLRVARTMRRFCCLLLLQQQQAAADLQQLLQQQLLQVEAELHALQQETHHEDGPVLQQAKVRLLLQRQRQLQQQQQQQQQWLQQLRMQQQRRWELLQNQAVWRAGSRLLSHTFRVIANCLLLRERGAGVRVLQQLNAWPLLPGNSLFFLELLGTAHAAAGRDAAAIEFFRKAARHAAASGAGLVTWAAAAARQRAVGDLQHAVLISLDRLSPDEPFFWAILGLYFSCVGLQDEAVEAFYKGIHLGDFYSEAFALCGKELTQQNQLEQAYEVFEVGLSRHVPSYSLLSGFAALLQRQRRHSEAAHVLCCCLRLFGSHFPAALPRLAHCLYTAGHPARAAAILKRAVSANPREGSLLLQLGKLQLEAKQHEAALENLLAAARLSPQQVCLSQLLIHLSPVPKLLHACMPPSHYSLFAAAACLLLQPTAHVLLSKVYSKMGDVSVARRGIT
ncbi:hypothetical protein Efla_004725 [Eimeria flavescens]